MKHSWTIVIGLVAGILATSRPATAGEVFVDFKTQGTVTTFTLDQGFVQITADDGTSPAQVFMLNLNGLGVVGGAADSTTDGMEALHFTFDELVAEAEYHVGLANNLDADGKLGEHTLEAFIGATSLGVVEVDDIGWKNVPAMFGAVGVTSFTVRADVDGNRIDAMRYTTSWTNAGNALAGTYGEPTLTGTGWLTVGTPVTMTANGMLENQLAALVMGFSILGAPFKGGVMVPSIDLLISGLSSGPLGVLQLGGTWPAGVPSGFTFFQQVWVVDPAGPQGFAATNAVRGIAP
jgi:hypothetical protein